MDADIADLPVGGVRVLDLAETLGAYCTRLLADIGADVVKIEPPDGDVLRRQPPFAGDEAGLETSLSFAYYHANKRGVALDYRQPDAVEGLRELAANCDVIVLTPSARNPIAGFDKTTGELSWAPASAVVCSITPFGLSGPYRDWRATHFTSHALSGLMYGWGPVAGPPVVVPGQQQYDHVGTHSAIAILKALSHRPEVGGQLIDMSAHEVLGQSYFDLYQYTNGQSITRRREIIPGVSNGVWQCRDGVVDVAMSTDKHWFGLVELLGNPEELGDPTWGNPGIRDAHSEFIIPIVAKLVAQLDREYFVSQGQSLGLPCSFINTVGDFANDRQPASRGYMVPQNRKGIGDVRMPGKPFASTVPIQAQYRRPAPQFGEHDAEAIGQEWQSTPSSTEQIRPLKGLRAISFGTAIAGALSGTALAELGADVVKIEGPARPDNLRRIRFPGEPIVHEPSGADTSPMFANFNRTTRSLALDMKDPASVAVFLRLVAECDVIVENYGPGVMDRWGVGYEQIAAANPRIVMLSLTGFGQTGPRRNYLAYGATVSSFAGLTQSWGYNNGTHYDYISEGHGVFGVLAALAGRDRTGKGTHVDLAEVEAAACMMAPLLLDYEANGRDSEPRGNRVPGTLLTEVVRCAGDDRWVAVELEDLPDWVTLAAVLGRADLADATSPPTEQQHADMVAALSEWAATLTPTQAMRRLQHAGIAAGAVQNSEDVVRDPQHRERHFLIEMDHPDLGVAEYAAPAHRLTKTPPIVGRFTPRLGEHNVEILMQWLGMDEAEAAKYAWPSNSAPNA